MSGFVAVGIELQLGAIWDAGEPQASVIAIARTRRKKKEAR
jgi:hypothetical protein